MPKSHEQSDRSIIPWHRLFAIGLNEVPAQDQNALWNLFSAERKRIEFGAARYRDRLSDASSLLKLLYLNYQKEGIMPYTKQDFWRDLTKAHLDSLSPDERLAGMSPDELLAAMPMEQLREVVRKGEQRLAQSPEKKGPQTKPGTKSLKASKRSRH